jgi:tRNA dimethylallyltransferase
MSPGFPLIAVLGPTGSGKSELGLGLAESIHGEIVNCDSVQVYRGLNIGTAKLPLCSRRGIPHHLIDVINLSQELTAGAYARLARQVLIEIAQRRAVPVLAGGTGFYFRALVDGLSPAPKRDEQLRTRLRRIARKRPGSLHRLLSARDPNAAARIHANDTQKVIRALELVICGGQPPTLIQSRPRDALQGFSVLKLGLAPDRAALYHHLNCRAARMFAQGLVEEAAQILAAGIPANAKPLQSLGYKQAVAVLEGRMQLEAAIGECQTKTRQYAKRQITWFRREAGIVWLHGFGTDRTIQREALEKTKLFIERLSTTH